MTFIVTKQIYYPKKKKTMVIIPQVKRTCLESPSPPYDYKKDFPAKPTFNILTEDLLVKLEPLLLTNLTGNKSDCISVYLDNPISSFFHSSY